MCLCIIHFNYTFLFLWYKRTQFHLKACQRRTLSTSSFSSQPHLLEQILDVSNLINTAVYRCGILNHVDNYSDRLQARSTAHLQVTSTHPKGLKVLLVYCCLSPRKETHQYVYKLLGIIKHQPSIHQLKGSYFLHLSPHPTTALRSEVNREVC